MFSYNNYNQIIQKDMNTNWSTPKRNVFAAINDLRHALAADYNARLIKIKNEDCSNPIRLKEQDTDFRNYEFSNGMLQSRANIAADTRRSEFEKYLSLSYKTCYGTPEAKERYYTKGLLSPDNFKGIGVSHLVKVDDMVAFFITTKDERAKMFANQYLNETTGNERHFFDNFRYEHGGQWTVKKFRRNVWVVELISTDEPKARLPWMLKTVITILNAILFPLKFIPSKSVLRMDNYKCITFRIGSVVNGLSVEFQIPKKFSFK